MRALCRKLLRCYFQQHSGESHGVVLRKPKLELLLDYQDISDLQTYYIAAICQPSSAAAGLCGAYSYSELRQQFCRKQRALSSTAQDSEPHRLAGAAAAGAAVHPVVCDALEAEQQQQDAMELQQQQRDAAEGAILGAFVGDAAGGVLEFLESFSTQQVEEALEMPGGGVWELGPGQITDDSEMALCLLQGLLGAPPTGPLPLDEIAAAFVRWLHSPPFDIGHTTRMALTLGRGNEQTAGLGARMTANAARHNQQSLSNGCLMRVTPLAVWARRQPVELIAQHASTQTALTHPNKTAQVGTASYCIAIAHLIQHPRDAAGAITAVREWLQQQQQEQQQDAQGSEAAGTVAGWLQEALQPGPGPDVTRNMGFMRWGFVHAFRALHLELPYTEAVRGVLLLGGDTDTNAATVGGLLGALWGAAAIPESMKGPVLSFGAGSQGQPRAAFLHAEHLPRLFEQLWSQA